MRPLSLDDPELTLSQVMATWPRTIEVFLRHRMLCVGCVVTPFHTIADACAEYHLCEEEFRDQLRKAAGPEALKPG